MTCDLHGQRFVWLHFDALFTGKRLSFVIILFSKTPFIYDWVYSLVKPYAGWFGDYSFWQPHLGFKRFKTEQPLSLIYPFSYCCRVTNISCFVRKYDFCQIVGNATKTKTNGFLVAKRCCRALSLGITICKMICGLQFLLPGKDSIDQR